MDYSRDFKADLTIGQEGEKFVAGFFSTGTKVEVKTDYMAYKTGNIAIEYMSRGRKSGLSTTDADYWAFVLEGEYKKEIVLFIEITRLKKLANKYYKLGKVVSGGDYNTSEMILIPIKELF